VRISNVPADVEKSQLCIPCGRIPEYIIEIVETIVGEQPLK